VVRRTVNGSTFYYATLNEAFAAAAGVSIEEPDEISVLADIMLIIPINIDTTKHIRLVPSGGNRTIWRDSTNVDDPLFRVTGENASLVLGKPGMEYDLFIDGGWQRTPPLQARSPLVVVNGLDAKVIMHDKVFLQNNNNNCPASGISRYQNGAGVFIRSETDNLERQPEFIMKGGTICGNINNTQNAFAYGGAVSIMGHGLFTMEGGVISGNTAYIAGGGLSVGRRASFKKTGGIIYGEDASAELRNMALNGTDSAPKIYGHVIMATAGDDGATRFRNGTSGENDNLSFTGNYANQPVFFGKDDLWTWVYTAPTPSGEPTGYSLTFVIAAVVISVLSTSAAFLAVLFILHRRRKKERLAEVKAEIAAAADSDRQAHIEIPDSLSPREGEVFILLLTEAAPKDIAYNLDISIYAVNKHISNIYRKLNVQSRTELFAKYGK
jgi:DNA-binding CsgD family transcriptional regulator